MLQGWILTRVDLAWVDRGGCPSGLAAPVDQEKGATRVNSGHCGLVTKSNMCNCPARRRSSCRRPSAHLMVFVEERFDRVLGLVRMVHGRADQSDVISVNDVRDCVRHGLRGARARGCRGRGSDRPGTMRLPEKDTSSASDHGQMTKTPLSLD